MVSYLLNYKADLFRLFSFEMLFKLSNIQKSYSGFDVLRGVSFQVNPNEKVGLVGRNGAGKTTLFRLVTGEESPDSGEVTKINGLKIGLLAQHVDFDSNDSVHTSALSAFKRIHDIEAEMRQLELEMAEDHSVLDRYAELQTEFEREGGFEYTAKAESILLGLGFSREDWKTPVSILSGGQQNRLGMARLLLSDSDLLLLDEPTNHLDVAAVEWLEDYLRSYDKTHVVISHDRYFLDRTCTRIVEIENGKAYTYSGNYSFYVKESELQKEQRQREYENQQAYISKTEAFIRKNLAGQKTKQAKSRRTLLERMEKVDRVTNEKKAGNFELGKVKRTGGNVLSAEDLEIGYPGVPLVTGIEILLHRGDCLGVIGGNGTGKTTFLKTILGEIRELNGTIRWGTKVDIGYYSQHLEDLEPNNDLMGEMRKIAPSAENGELRSFLAAFLFTGEDVFKRVGDLSGGEKGRLSLAKLIYSKSNVLVLDEPTNHLDIPSRESLESALESYDGTIITVSHDRYFLDRVASQILSLNPDGTATNSLGNYTEYQHQQTAEKEFAKPLNEKDSGIAAAQSTNYEKQSARSKESDLSKNQIKRLKQRINEIETETNELEREQENLTNAMNDPQTVANSTKFAELTAEYEKLEEKSSVLLAEWEDLVERVSE